ncbi:MAG: class I tRNA ligase family protein [Chthoniobacterales bacterium]
MSSQRKQYPFPQFEPKWQQRWAESQAYRTPNPGEPGFDAAKPKYYVLDMFPYPSGEGLHVGHPEGYTATDILARWHRMRGFNVLHPMGWDAFGLPAEQYAVKTGQHPAVTTAKNVARFKEQLDRIGFSYDWSRQVNTTDPDYVRWTQWIFLQIYNSWFNPETNRAEPVTTYKGDDPDSVRLAYVAEMPVNWCPELGTVLANEEVVDGQSEVGGFPVERRPMRQWILRITAFAERLLAGLDTLDWPESIKLLQKNWIGRSEGAFVDFSLESGGKLTVYTTRPDTLFGATYMVLAPENALVATITTPDQRAAVDAYIKTAATKSERDRQDASKEKTGVFTGAYAINPVNQARTPVWIADYVLTGYGTGAIMAVPAHDDRDHAFALKYNLPILEVVQSGIGFQPMNPRENISIRSGANLPHWTQDGATYAVSFRLSDSLPTQVLQQWQEDRNYFLERSGKEDLSPKEKKELQKLFSEKIDAALDAGHGECWLARPQITQLVQDTLHHFNGQRYDLLAWCIMPNHVHVVLRPTAGNTLSDILHSWKSYSATEANRVLGRSGSFWQTEAFDHLVRDSEDFANQVRYVLKNPGKAGLEEWKWCGSAVHRQDADATDGGEKSGIGILPMSPFTGDGVAVSSGILDGLPTAEAKQKITLWLAERDLGRAAVQFKLRDWLFSRQRYWGEPFPVVWENGRHRALEESELPVRLPELEDFKPTGTAEPPLAKARGWVEYSDTATRELNTMPQWAGSCWYYLRYCDPRNDQRFIGEEAARYWLGDGQPKPGGVDLYVGGTEHAVLHLLYSRFWHMVLHDLGHLPTPEPFQRLVNQGIILGTDGQKMSKSRGNVVNPDEVIDDYGADAFRLYEMFMGPLEQMKPWSMKGVEGVYRFLARAWRLAMTEDQEGNWQLSGALADIDPTPSQLRVLHATIKKVTGDLATLSFNTAISQMMICVNELTSAEQRPVSALRTLLILLSPFAPHMAEELWEQLGNKFPGFEGAAHAQTWPTHDESLLVENEVEIVLQLNGKVRDKMIAAKDATREQLEATARAHQKFAAQLAGKEVVKVIAVPGKLVNFVVKD